MRFRIAATLLAAWASMLSAPTRAEVSAASDTGFVVSGEVDLAGQSQRVWQELVHPQRWWSDDHSWSGDAGNMALDPVAGGCFCEAVPGNQPGSAEHMRVVQVRPGELLVMRGAIGPMQGEALTAVLTLALASRADGEGARLSWSYVVGGYARFPLTDLAPAVDGVISEQMARLQAHLAAAN
jgi:uncharacterized protein YndB with AHSA1/START domain